MTDQAPEYSPFFAVMGASAAMVFSGNYHTVITFDIQAICSLQYVDVCCFLLTPFALI